MVAAVTINGFDELTFIFDNSVDKLNSTQMEQFFSGRLLDHRIETARHFNLKGGGKYAPLSPKYTVWKTKKYPGQKMLNLTGALKKAVSGRQGITKDTISEISKRGFTHGTSLPYAGYVHGGTSLEGKELMPARPFFWLSKPFIRRSIRNLFEFLDMGL
jgi:phage gpG-like protein